MTDASVDPAAIMAHHKLEWISAKVCYWCRVCDQYLDSPCAPYLAAKLALSIHYQDSSVVLHHGDCIKVMRTMPANSFDSIVTDPPYGLGFMGKAWDDLPPGLPWAQECLRVLKPGGHLLAFGGSRTWHRLAVAVEDAGFELRDSIAWLYGSGFPKSLDVSKAIDKAAGAAPATEAAQQWQGWGTALKPAFEPIVMGRKPLTGTVAANVLAHGTGALNIDECRIGTNGETWAPSTRGPSDSIGTFKTGTRTTEQHPAGRWPANVILDKDQAAALDEQSGDRRGFSSQNFNGGTSGKAEGWGNIGAIPGERREGLNDTGGASRFFYTAKADAGERITHNGVAHPTVKPLSIMRWLVRLVTPPGGTVLEPFAGSGTTVEACILEGFRCIAIEREAEYLPLITQRVHRRRDPIAYLTASGDQLGLFGEDGAA